jgi:hypothetical protein
MLSFSVNRNPHLRPQSPQPQTALPSLFQKQEHSATLLQSIPCALVALFQKQERPATPVKSVNCPLFAKTPGVYPLSSFNFQLSIFNFFPNSFTISRSKKPARNPFIICTSKTKDLKPRRISTYEKHRGVGVILLTRYPAKGICPERPSGAKDLSSRPHNSSNHETFRHLMRLSKVMILLCLKLLPASPDRPPLEVTCAL